MIRDYFDVDSIKRDHGDAAGTWFQTVNEIGRRFQAIGQAAAEHLVADGAPLDPQGWQEFSDAAGSTAQQIVRMLMGSAADDPDEASQAIAGETERHFIALSQHAFLTRLALLTREPEGMA